MYSDKTKGRKESEKQDISHPIIINKKKTNHVEQYPESGRNRPFRVWSEWEKTFDAVGDSILIINNDFKIIQANIAVTRLLERPFGEIIGRTCWEVVHNTQKPLSQCPLKKACRTKQHEEMELYIPDRHLWLHISVSPILDESGNINSAVHIIRDITKQKLAEQVILKEKNRVQKYLDVVAVMMIAIDSEQRVGLINKKGCEILGCGEDEVLGKNWFDNFVPRRFRDEIKSLFKEIISGQADCPEYHECPVLTRGGDERLIAWHCTILKDDKNRIYAILNSGEDVTERKRTEEALQESESMFRAVAALSPAAIAILKSDEQGERFLYVNTAWEILTGYLQADAMRLNLKKITHPDMRELVEQRAAARIRGEDVPSRYENKIVTKDGKIKWLDFAAAVIRYKDEPAILTIALDITKRKMAEQKLLEERMMLKSMASELTLAEERERQRIATYLHDHIAQNLAMSKFWLQQVQQLHTDKKLEYKLSEVLKVLDKVIDSTRSVTFNLSLPTLLEQGLETALKELLSAEIEKKHGIRTEFKDDGLPKPLDEEIRILLYRDIRELLINVIKHAHATKVKVSVSRVGERIRVCVEDNGVGFDTEVVRRNTLKKRGFGLFSIRQRLEQLGGQFEIGHEPGRGGIVMIEVPLKTDRK
jgi:PAS domain S-box-containing protein